MKKIASVLFLALTVPAAAMEIRVHPGHQIYLYELDARRGLSTAMIQNLAIVQPGGEAVRLSALTVELRAGDFVRQTLSYGQTDLSRAAARMPSRSAMRWSA